MTAMTNATVVGFSGNLARPSKTRGFVKHFVSEIADRHGLAAVTFDLDDVGRSLGTARWSRDLDEAGQTVLDAVVSADVLVVGSPTYKGSYTGLFKHFFDLVDPVALRGKPVLLTATGGGERHALMVDHQLRPLFAFFEALVLPTAVYATDRDFLEGALASEAIRKRGEQAIEEAGLALASRRHAAAEDFAPSPEMDGRPRSLIDRYWLEWIPRL
ncbi:FMN reductase (NADPH) [Mesorhizobium delmotii]|uniref:FMN reductase (NADPH) n=2 Tax=Mesorhizobium delmotii TaxID=1631247 RepID=A0A2P9AHF5_9HYPH|nr:FMN reductase (NADPH) [Mesorhizobium delmotii]